MNKQIFVLKISDFGPWKYFFIEKKIYVSKNVIICSEILSMVKYCVQSFEQSSFTDFLKFKFLKQTSRNKSNTGLLEKRNLFVRIRGKLFVLEGELEEKRSLVRNKRLNTISAQNILLVRQAIHSGKDTQRS